MELRLEPELAAKVGQWSAQTGRPADELVEDAVANYLQEVDDLRSLLDSRYDDMLSGKVKGVPGEEARRILEERMAVRQRSIA
jgi:predicted DNA-binding protein